MSKEKSLSQALHNSELCKVLIDNTNYPDWVITSAFYSVIHFVRYRIFPLPIPKTDGTPGLDMIATFEDYKRRFYPHNQVNPHQILLDLVKDNCRPILEDYKILKGLCHGGGSGNVIPPGMPYAGVFGQGIVAASSYAFHINRLIAPNTPLTGLGLSTGSVYYLPATTPPPPGAKLLYIV